MVWMAEKSRGTRRYINLWNWYLVPRWGGLQEHLEHGLEHLRPKWDTPPDPGGQTGDGEPARQKEQENLEKDQGLRVKTTVVPEVTAAPGAGTPRLQDCPQQIPGTTSETSVQERWGQLKDPPAP